MLGWRIVITTQRPEGEKSPLASWSGGLGAIDWLDSLVKAGRAVSLGGDGYPFRYTATAAVVASALTAGPPPHDGPIVIGDDYVSAGGWTSGVKVDSEALAKLPKDESLLVEAWDLS